MLRGFCILAAASMLAAVAHMAITTRGGYGTPYSFTVIAMTIALACGSLAVGHAAKSGRRAMAFMLALFLIACETYAFAITARNIVAQGLEAGRPAHRQAKALQAAIVAHTEAKEVVSLLDGPSHRVKAATKALMAAQRAAAEDAPKAKCATNCRRLHEKAIAYAANELGKAREEQQKSRNAAAKKLKDASATLKGLDPAQPNPLVEILGLSEVKIDLAVALVGAAGLNGFAAVLLMFAGHGWTRPKEDPVSISQEQFVSRFAFEMLEPSPNNSISFREIFETFQAWSNGSSIPAAEFAAILIEMFTRHGYPIRRDTSGTVVVIGVSRKPLMITQS